jgi:hypothetical protein
VVLLTGERVEDRFPGASCRGGKSTKIPMTYRYILGSFSTLGRGPTMTEMVWWSTESER